MFVGDYLRAVVSFAAPNLKDGAKMVWDWELTQVELPLVLSLAGEEIVDAIIARYYAPLVSILSSQLTITQIELRAYDYPEDGYIAAGTLWQGTATGALMPPANALAIQLIRTNFTLRNGRKAYPGAISGTVGANGTVEAGAVNAFRTATNAWGTTSMEVELSVGNGATFDEVVIKAPVSYALPVVTAQRVTEYSDVYWGTQNSRK